MGFNKNIINKVYIILRPENIDRAIVYMSKVDGRYQHNFIPHTNPKLNNLCYICKRSRRKHIEYQSNDINEENQENNIIISEQEKKIKMMI